MGTCICGAGAGTRTALFVGAGTYTALCVGAG